MLQADDHRFVEEMRQWHVQKRSGADRAGTAQHQTRISDRCSYRGIPFEATVVKTVRTGNSRNPKANLEV